MKHTSRISPLIVALLALAPPTVWCQGLPPEMPLPPMKKDERVVKAQQQVEAERKKREAIETSQAGTPVYAPLSTFQDKLSDGSLGPEMVVIPAGKYQMGSSAEAQAQAVPDGLAKENSDRESPQHWVKLDKAFAVGKFEVRRAQFSRFVTATGHKSSGCGIYDHSQKVWRERDDHDWRNPGFEQGEDHPVVCVNWDDAQEYIKWLSTTTRQRYRLLSEAEWEYAARAGSSTARFWGNDAKQACRYANVSDQAVERQYPGWQWASHNCDDGAANTAKVGRYQPNAWGLYDMIGNAWEWVEDCWSENYAGNQPADEKARTVGDCRRQVLRGGSWGYSPDYARSASRVRSNTSLRDVNVGFRLARMLP